VINELFPIQQAYIEALSVMVCHGYCNSAKRWKVESSVILISPSPFILALNLPQKKEFQMFTILQLFLYVSSSV